MRFEEGYGVMEKKRFGEPPDNVGYSKDLEEAKKIANKATWRWVVKMWKEGGVWHFDDEVVYRSFFWPRPLNPQRMRRA